MEQEIVIIDKQDSKDKISKLANEQFGNLVKAVVDIEQKVMAVGGEMHADEEALLLENGSKQETLWGINLYPEQTKEDWIEFDSMINIRPRQNNRSRGVEDAEIRKKIIEIVNNLII